MDLRPYQVEAVEQAREQMRRGAKRVLLVLATGGGKTVVGGVRSVRRGGPRHAARDAEVVHHAHREQPDAAQNRHRRPLVMCERRDHTRNSRVESATTEWALKGSNLRPLPCESVVDRVR